MYAEVEYEGRKYSVTVTREGRVTVEEFDEVPASGVLAGALTELCGKVATHRLILVTTEEAQREVILACGWKFSRSQAWKDTWDSLYRGAGGLKSGWGQRRVRVLFK